MPIEPAGSLSRKSLESPPEADGNGHAPVPDGRAVGEAARNQAAPNADEIGAPPPVPRPQKRSLLLLAVAAVVALAGLFLLGWLPHLHEQNALNAEAERIATAVPRVSVAHPRQSPAVVETLLPGDVQAMEETTVYPRTSGYLKRWLVDIGDHVTAGQLLAEIDTPDVDQQLLQAQATLGQLKANRLRADAARRLAEATWKRYQALDKDNAVSKLDVDQRRADLETAESNVAAGKASVAAGEANVEVGQLLTSGNGVSQSLFHLAKTNPVRVFVNVPQVYSPGVKVGLEAEL